MQVNVIAHWSKPVNETEALMEDHAQGFGTYVWSKDILGRRFCDHLDHNHIANDDDDHNLTIDIDEALKYTKGKNNYRWYDEEPPRNEILLMRYRMFTMLLEKCKIYWHWMLNWLGNK